MKKLINIDNNIAIGHNDVELYMTVSIDSEVIVEKRCDSLVANFLRALYSFASGELVPAGFAREASPGTNQGDYSDTTAGRRENISSITNAVSSGANTVISETGDASPSGFGATHVQISGLIGDWTACNGFHEVVSSTASSVTIAVDSSLFGALDLSNSPALRMKRINADSDARGYDKSFSSPHIIVGCQDDAVGIDDQTLYSEVQEGSGTNDILYGNTTVSAAVSAAGTTEIAMSADLTNSSGGTVAIRESGIIVILTNTGPPFDQYANCLIARDLLTVNIPDGKTATISYRLSTTMGASGGLTKQFLELLSRHLRQTSVSVNTIDNTLSTSSDADGTFGMASPGGNNKVQILTSGVEGNFVGPQVGTGNTAVANDDFALETRIAHGKAAGELVYYGTLVENFLVGDTPGEASFDVIRIFENQSGGNISVEETALYATIQSTIQNTPYCIARHVQAAPVVVADGELLKVTYRIKLVV